MKATKITIRNLFGITERTLDGKSIEMSGPKGSGKTSGLDAIRLALTNRSGRDYTIKQGADEGEILIETNTGLSIERKLRSSKADSLRVKNGDMVQSRPSEFLSTIFTPLQLNPVEFCQLSRQEKNRVILSLIEFDWDTNWIVAQFGELPQGIDYGKHILEVLSDIQAENGVYFQSRQNLNRDVRNKQAFVADIAKDIPADYQFDKWNDYDLNGKFRELASAKEANATIERAKVFLANYNDKVRGLEGKQAIAISAIDLEISSERESLNKSIDKLKSEIQALEVKLDGLATRKNERVELVNARHNEAIAKLAADNGIATTYSEKTVEDVTALSAEISEAEEMRKHLNEYQRMITMQNEAEVMAAASAELTRKIELARELPASILAAATIPISGLTVVDGIPLINNLPISNLSDGELLELCVDITVSKPGQLEIILIDGAERLDKISRDRLYARCKENGLQIIATRVSDSDEMEIIEL